MKEFNDPLKAKNTPSAEKTSAEDIESEKRQFVFDIRQKHAKSKDLYRERTNMVKVGDEYQFPEYDRILAESKNPFIDLNNKEILYKDEKVGVLHVDPDLFPQCVYGRDGNMKCGFFYRISVEVTSKTIDLETAKKLVLEAIGTEKRIDYMTIDEYPEKGPVSLLGENLETSEFLEQGKNAKI
jgi:hypothetical protein